MLKTCHDLKIILGDKFLLRNSFVNLDGVPCPDPISRPTIINWWNAFGEHVRVVFGSINSIQLVVWIILLIDPRDRYKVKLCPPIDYIFKRGWQDHFAKRINFRQHGRHWVIKCYFQEMANSHGSLSEICFRRNRRRQINRWRTGIEHFHGFVITVRGIICKK